MDKHARTQSCLVDDLLGCSFGLDDPKTTIPFRFSFISFDCGTRASGIVVGSLVEFRLTGNSLPAVKVPDLIVRWFVISCEAPDRLASAVFPPVRLEPGTGDLFWLAEASPMVDASSFTKVDARENLLSLSGMMGSRSCCSDE